MPITLTDENGNEIDLEKADGGTLRSKLEEALAENRNLIQTVSTLKAKDVLEANGYSLVKPEDLAGVAPDEVETKAKELQEQRHTARVETIKGVLAEKGLEGEALDKAVEDLLGGEGNPVTRESVQDDIDLAGLGSLPGIRPNRTPDLPGLDDAMGNLVGAFE